MTFRVAIYVATLSVACGGQTRSSGTPVGTGSTAPSTGSATGGATGVAGGVSAGDIAAGMSTGGIPGNDAGSDAANDAGRDAGNSCGSPPAGCARIENATPCDQGFICDPTQGCTPSECWCGLFSAPGTWACSADCGGGVCVAADAAATVVACPAVPPRVGEPCVGPIACPYNPACGTELFVCGGAPPLWGVTGYSECSDGCPPFEPAVGNACSSKGTCSYTSACGGSDVVTCNGVAVVQVQPGACPATTVCGGAAAASCAHEEWCDYGAGCGGGGAQGQCRPAGVGSALDCTNPVCGCDGRAYCNAWVAHMNGVGTALRSCITGDGGVGAACLGDKDCQTSLSCCQAGGTLSGLKCETSAPQGGCIGTP